MKLITKEMENRFAVIGVQSQNSDPIIVAKFFDKTRKLEWYVIEYNPKSQMCSCYLKGCTDEWGVFYIPNLESAERSLELTIERDINFKEIHLSELIKEQNKHKDIYKKQISDLER